MSAFQQRFYGANAASLIGGLPSSERGRGLGMSAHVRYKVTGGQSCYPVTISQLFCFWLGPQSVLRLLP
jgi:hypothetical protein